MTSKLADKVYALLRNIPKGKVVTYKELAHAAGTKGYQAIGQILKQNPDAPQTPCHRVIKSDQTLGGYAGKKDNSKKELLLRKEGIRIVDNKVDEQHLFSFTK